MPVGHTGTEVLHPAEWRKSIDIPSEVAAQIRDGALNRGTVEVYGSGHLNIGFDFDDVLRHTTRGTFVFGRFTKGPAAWERCMLHFPNSASATADTELNIGHLKLMSCKVMRISELSELMS